MGSDYYPHFSKEGIVLIIRQYYLPTSLRLVTKQYIIFLIYAVLCFLFSYLLLTTGNKLIMLLILMLGIATALFALFEIKFKITLGEETIIIEEGSNEFKISIDDITLVKYELQEGSESEEEEEIDNIIPDVFIFTFYNQDNEELLIIPENYMRRKAWDNFFNWLFLHNSDIEVIDLVENGELEKNYACFDFEYEL